MGSITRFRSLILSMAIAIVFILFVIYGINTIYSEPKIDSFCNDSSYERVKVSSCEDYISEEGVIDIEDTCFCDAEGNECTAPNSKYVECKGMHDKSMLKYDFVVFIIMISIGGAVILGSFFITVKEVSFGLMGGGLVLVIIGAIRNWNHSEDWMKFILFGIILAVLIWFGSRRFGGNDFHSTKPNRHKDYEE